MKNKIKYTVLAILALVAVVVFSSNIYKNPEGERSEFMPVDGKPPGLPAFAMKDMQGRDVNLQSLKGKKVFVNLWASWCPPCRTEMPSIEKLYGR